MSADIRGPLGVVIVAAGSGVRYGDPAKALAIVAGKPLLEYSLNLFTRELTVEQIVVVFGEHTLHAGAMLIASLRLRDVAICAGGATRGASVRAGVELLDPAICLVAVHDAARPLATSALFRRVVAAARIHGAAVPGVSVNDTMLNVDPEGRVTDTPDRRALRAIQTPQVARRDWLLSALGTSEHATDEGSLLHLAGYPVVVVDGDLDNLKITYPDDVDRAATLLANRTGVP